MSMRHSTNQIPALSAGEPARANQPTAAAAQYPQARNRSRRLSLVFIPSLSIARSVPHAELIENEPFSPSTFVASANLAWDVPVS
jgi:hypothetical protein